MIYSIIRLKSGKISIIALPIKDSVIKAFPHGATNLIQTSSEKEARRKMKELGQPWPWKGKVE